MTVLHKVFMQQSLAFENVSVVGTSVVETLRVSGADLTLTKEESLTLWFTSEHT